MFKSLFSWSIELRFGDVYYPGRIKALLLRHKTTAAATNAAWLRQPLRPATAAAAIEKAAIEKE